MSLIINRKIDELYKIVCSKKFLTKTFLLPDDTVFNKNDKQISFERIYTHVDLKQLSAVPDNILSFVETHAKNIQITASTNHNIIKHTDKCFIVKYITILKKPDYIHSILKDTKIILYVQFKVNINDPSMTVVHFNKKLVNYNEVDDDNLVINAEENDVITNIYQQDTLVISPSLIIVAETFLGNSLVHDFIIPFINDIYNMAFSVMQDIYTNRMVKYLTKKGIDIYKKK